MVGVEDDSGCLLISTSAAPLSGRGDEAKTKDEGPRPRGRGAEGTRPSGQGRAENAKGTRGRGADYKGPMTRGLGRGAKDQGRGAEDKEPIG